ncbi:GntR family transcriptional regulator [Micromonospora sp. WMMA1363]|uniref:GntR family transcriptional regulator n=1 Tax=Micromonospora sp. WMMA1363 TaxID=3053985 RepID=UPI00259CD9A6|nr:GntR family transcriptional regulator [Micromonospora sp. WMMA1363]MDM4718560.1 GntR family transcriptional regulator [Micromonospora sp. WMMA1363]
MDLKAVGRTLLRDQAYAAIRSAIVAGTLAPGQVVRDRDLAERLGFSRAPVRDALARLADEGLVESKPQSHTRVTPLILRDVRDALVVVRTMHEVAARAAVHRLSPADLDTMRAANTEFARAVRAGDVERALTADDSLHDVLVVAGGNRAVAATIDRYTPLIRRLERQRFGTVPGEGSIRRHEALIQACAARDPGAATEITATIWSSLDEILRADVQPLSDELSEETP